MTGPTPGPPIPVSPTPPAGLAAKLQAMSIAEIETFLDQLRAAVKPVQVNPPPGRQTDIDMVVASLSLAETISGQKHQAVQPPPVAADSNLNQAVAAVTAVISGS